MINFGEWWRPKGRDNPAEGATALTAELCRRFSGEQDDYFFSPLGIEFALDLVRLGARGTTRHELDKVVRRHGARDASDDLLAAIRLELESRSNPTRSEMSRIEHSESAGRQSTGDEDPEEMAWMHGSLSSPEVFGFHFKMANGLWHQSDWPIHQNYIENLQARHGIEPLAVDFTNQPASACERINRWVEERTDGRITGLLSEHSLAPLTRLILCNALYFKARWNSLFAAEETADKPFHLLDGQERQVPMMTQAYVKIGYEKAADIEVVSIPYVRTECQFVVLMPRLENFRGFERKLDERLIDSLVFGPKPDIVAENLSMPKFRLRSTQKLREPLADIGLRATFTESADFSSISPEQGFHVDDILHASVIAVDEEGTEAAAATMPAMIGMSMPERSLDVTLDRPFFFFIVDLPTRTVLFAGRLTEPR